jgi:hypothetical protein
LQKEKGWVNVVVLADVPEFFSMITVHQVVKIQRKLTLLKHAIISAFENPNKTWETVFEETANHFNYENLSKWRLGKVFAQFNDKSHRFKLPHPDSRNVNSKEGKLKKKIDHFILTNQHWGTIFPILLLFSPYNINIGCFILGFFKCHNSVIWGVLFSFFFNVYSPYCHLFVCCSLGCYLCGEN